MMPVFPPVFAILIDHEKGFVEDPKDLGGANNLRVSLRFLKSTGLLYDLNRDGVVEA